MKAEKEQLQSRRRRKLIKLFPDSSWLISYLNPKDAHHEHVRACMGMLEPGRPIFFFSTIVIMETMSGLIRRGFTAKQASDTLINFISKVDERSERSIKLSAVLKKYQAYAKARKINKLTTNDFYIVTEAMSIGAKLLTSDKRMYKTAKASYKQTYLISISVKNIKSDLPRLGKDLFC